MNKKVVNIVLILVVCGIWSVVIYRFIRNQSADNMVQESLSPAADYSGITRKRKEFSLHKMERDPFLEGTENRKKPVYTNSAGSSSSHRPTSPTMTQPIPTAPVVTATHLRFQGVVKNNSTNSTIALITFNGKSVRMTQGQVHDGYKLEKIYRDSALLSHNKEKIIARK